MEEKQWAFKSVNIVNIAWTSSLKTLEVCRNFTVCAQMGLEHTSYPVCVLHGSVSGSLLFLALFPERKLIWRRGQRTSWRWQQQLIQRFPGDHASRKRVHWKVEGLLFQLPFFYSTSLTSYHYSPFLPLYSLPFSSGSAYGPYGSCAHEYKRLHHR